MSDFWIAFLFGFICNPCWIFVLGYFATRKEVKPDFHPKMGPPEPNYFEYLDKEGHVVGTECPFNEHTLVGTNYCRACSHFQSISRVGERMVVVCVHPRY